MKRFLTLALAFAIFNTAHAQQPTPQQQQPSQPTTQTTVAASPLERRANEVCAQFRQTPGDYDKMFTAAFLAEVPPNQLSPVFTSYFELMGRCTGARLTQREGANAGRFEFTFEKSYTVAVALSVEAAAPNLIDGLQAGAPTAASASPTPSPTPARTQQTLTDVVTELKTFPGETGFLFAKLNGNTVSPVVAHNADKPLAIGSAFKLYILSQLTRELKAGERKLSDVVLLDAKAASLPSGMLQDWQPVRPSLCTRSHL